MIALRAAHVTTRLDRIRSEFQAECTSWFQALPQARALAQWRAEGASPGALKVRNMPSNAWPSGANNQLALGVGSYL
jgi:hypothetical protein